MTFPFEGEQREYWIYKPETVKPGAPLVVVLHGYALPYPQTPKDMNVIADREGFVVCYPQGRIDQKGRNYWNIGYPIHKDMTNDDVAFVKALSRHIMDSENLSQAFLCGFSNGGDMCYLTALSGGGFFTAYASVAGLFLSDWKTKYDPKAVAPFMEIHGTADLAARWAGDYDGADGWGKYISVREAVQYMIDKDGCSSFHVDTLRQKGAHKAIMYTWGNGRSARVPVTFPSSQVKLCKVEGASHGWQTEDVDTFELMWDFFKRYLSWKPTLNVEGLSPDKNETPIEYK